MCVCISYDNVSEIFLEYFIDSKRTYVHQIEFFNNNTVSTVQNKKCNKNMAAAVFSVLHIAKMIELCSKENDKKNVALSNEFSFFSFNFENDIPNFIFLAILFFVINKTL